MVYLKFKKYRENERIHKKILRIITTLILSMESINAILHNSTLIKKGIKVDILTCDNSVSYIKDKNITVYNMGPSLLGRYGFSLNYFG